jgi:hypothetical protein
MPPKVPAAETLSLRMRCVANAPHGPIVVASQQQRS